MDDVLWHTMDSFENSREVRQNFEENLSIRRKSLSVKEFKFLTDVALQGNDEEIKLAKKKAC